MQLSDVITERRSVKHYAKDHEIDDEELKAIFDEVILSPSSFNLQHWMFVVVRDPENKTAMQAAAWNQEQVGDCAALIVVCGKLDAHNDAAVVWQDAPESVRETLVPMTIQFYEGKTQLSRDEAIRSASLAAMTLMLVAKSRGWDTGPMIGFDPEQVAQLAGLSENYLPVMLITLGKGEPSDRPRGYRRPLSEIVKLERLEGHGLP